MHFFTLWRQFRPFSILNCDSHKKFVRRRENWSNLWVIHCRLYKPYTRRFFQLDWKMNLWTGEFQKTFGYINHPNILNHLLGIRKATWFVSFEFIIEQCMWKLSVCWAHCFVLLNFCRTIRGRNVLLRTIFSHNGKIVWAEYFSTLVVCLYEKYFDEQESCSGFFVSYLQIKKLCKKN